MSPLSLCGYNGMCGIHLGMQGEMAAWVMCFHRLFPLVFTAWLCWFVTCTSPSVSQPPTLVAHTEHHCVILLLCTQIEQQAEVQGARSWRAACVSSAALTCRASCSCALAALLLCACNVVVTLRPAHRLSRPRSVRGTLHIVSFRTCGSGHTARRPI